MVSAGVLGRTGGFKGDGEACRGSEGGCGFIIVIRVFYAFLRCVLPRTLLGFLLFLVLHLFSLNFAKYLYGIVLAGGGCCDQVGFYGGEPGFYGLGQEVLLVQDGFGGFGNLGVGGFFGYVLFQVGF